MTDPTCGLCNDRKKYPSGVVVRGCPVHDPAPVPEGNQPSDDLQPDASARSPLGHEETA